MSDVPRPDSIGARLGLRQAIGPYQLGPELGRGGMGIVYLATQTGLNRKVALKVLDPALALDKTFTGRFRHEADSLARLDSPHVIAIYDVGEADGLFYIAMQYVSGGDLASFVHQNGPLPPRTALSLFAQLVEALGDAHAVGVIHRDVKPANVLLRQGWRDPYLYLGDFGIAAQQAEDGLTRTGMVVGSLAYMAPERHHGLPASEQSDIYSAACVLWVMLTGKTPYSGTDFQHAMAHVSAPIPQLDGTDAGTAAINELLAWCMAKEPAQRPRDARELLVRIDEAVRQLGDGGKSDTVDRTIARSAVAEVDDRTVPRRGPSADEPAQTDPTTLRVGPPTPTGDPAPDPTRLRPGPSPLPDPSPPSDVVLRPGSSPLPDPSPPSDVVLRPGSSPLPDPSPPSDVVLRPGPPPLPDPSPPSDVMLREVAASSQFSRNSGSYDSAQTVAPTRSVAAQNNVPAATGARPTRSRKPRTARIVIAVAAALALIFGGVYFGTGGFASLLPQTAPTPGSTWTPTVAPRPTPTVAPGPTWTPAPVIAYTCWNGSSVTQLSQCPLPSTEKEAFAYLDYAFPKFTSAIGTECYTDGSDSPLTVSRVCFADDRAVEIVYSTQTYFFATDCGSPEDTYYYPVEIADQATSVTAISFVDNDDTWRACVISSNGQIAIDAFTYFPQDTADYMLDMLNKVTTVVPDQLQGYPTASGKKTGPIVVIR